MRLIPSTLFARNLLLIAALVVGGQVVNALAYRELIAKPRLEQSAEATARSLQAVAEGLRLLPEAQRASFAARFNARAGSGQPEAMPERPSLMERAFIDELAADLGLAPTELAWQREAGGLIAVRLPDLPYWLDVPSVQPARRFARTWLIASGVSAALALLGAWLIQRRINRPLERLVGAAQAVGAGQRRLALPTDGPAETAALARGFNDMAEALARDEEERLLMLAGLSHDLRTPLAKIRLASEMLRDAGQGDKALLDTLDRSLHGLDGLLTQFLDYARASHPAEQELPAVEVELREFLAETVALAPGLPQPLRAGGPAVWWRARPQALRRLVLNLVVNAQNHGAPPIELDCGEAAGAAWIEVRDRGPGIVPGRVDELKRPFRRGDAARGGQPGSGLGLAIVERIARAQGARLQLLAREGGGLVARVQW
ncbi:ATP-binding protein [Roseateles saccharophilus]|uniref:histidine kinase n=1 Tax=Roseateles saccharophilus TaxID=304 RepID=A0A4R3V7Y3_ROSSA|nr:ATP-binding protein [Roseateles saccharophilus]MDG0831735.1 HAMP domain-containing protein [Roseateles saccharophilus]TCV01247.1 two-component system osmolarity sensor histidine kinase EnvZ [Roseateles saccharophilus]